MSLVYLFSPTLLRRGSWGGQGTQTMQGTRGGGALVRALKRERGKREERTRERGERRRKGGWEWGWGWGKEREMEKREQGEEKSKSLYLNTKHQLYNSTKEAAHHPVMYAGGCTSACHVCTYTRAPVNHTIYE